MLTYDFRLPPGPRTVEYALLAEDLGFRAVWCPGFPPSAMNMGHSRPHRRKNEGIKSVPPC